MQPWSPSGLPTVPQLQWGSHLAHFFGSGDELRDLLVPYFTAGLRNNEQCLWVTGKAFNADDARSALRNAVPDLDKRERGRQIEIVDGDEWYAAGEKLKPRELVSGLVQREQTLSERAIAVSGRAETAPGSQASNCRIFLITRRSFRKRFAADA
ncbi:hypothetical protein ABID65_008807 [Bradyrhizobium sp. S3.9.2]